MLRGAGVQQLPLFEDYRDFFKQKPIWFKGVRSSKFRHVYGEPAKRNKCYENIQITKNAHDSQFCAVNPKFLAVVTEVAGGGAFMVVPINCTGRLDFNASRVTGHSGPILDIKWNPFNDNVIASCSDDCTIKLWHIPDDGLSVNLNDWLVELQGHKRRVAYIEWHPTAENVLLSAGFDHLVIVWDIEKGEAINVIDCHRDAIHSMSLNRDGSLLATTCKDKKLRVIEPRTGMVKSEGICHEGSKASKVAYLGSTGRLLTTGFSRHSDRRYAVWDENDLSKPLFADTIDSSSGIVFPFFDPDTNIVFLAGKGDGNIRFYEISDEPPYIHYLNQVISGNPQGVCIFGKDARTYENLLLTILALSWNFPTPEQLWNGIRRKAEDLGDQKFHGGDPYSGKQMTGSYSVLIQFYIRNYRGMGVMPKRGLRTFQCEIYRFFKLHPSKGLCEPISMVVPRKSDHFHEDLYPDTVAPKPALTAQEWIKGSNAPPVLMSMKTGESHALDIEAIKQRKFKIKEPSVIDNNKRKFQFLSTETVPDYRPKELIDEKSKKTTTNQTTKFQQLQQRWSASIDVPHKDIPLLKEINSIGDNILTENDLRLAYNSQSDEIRKLKKQLANSENRVRELEEHIKRLTGK